MRAASVGLCAALATAGVVVFESWKAIAPPEPIAVGPPADRREPVAASAELLEAAPRDRAEALVARPPEGGDAPVRSVPAQASDLAGSIVPEIFDLQNFVVHARTIAHAASAAEVEEWVRLAGDASTTDAQRVAAAEVLRHVAPSETGEMASLAPRAALTLRRAWLMRETDPVLARAAAPALGAFGDTQDRRAMLDVLRTSASAADVALARAGLSAARGDEAALEMLGTAESAKDEQIVDGVLCALTTMAGADRSLSAEGRTQCAQILERMLARADPHPGPCARLRSALAAMRSRPEHALAGP